MRLSSPMEWIAPEERASARALPLTLLVRTAPLLALVVLALNDHVFKGSGLLPSWLTGKLSDFAGLVFFPLLLVTLFNLLGHALFLLRNKIRVNPMQPSATHTQLVAALLSTGVFFSLVQLVPAVARFYARVSALLMSPLGVGAKVTMDPTDLVSLTSLLFAWWLGRRAIAKVPPGRLPWIQFVLREVPDAKSRAAFTAAALGDVRAALPKDRRPDLDALVRAVAEDENPDVIDAILLGVRGRA